MTSSTMEIKDIKNISEKLTTENKKYVIAVANALLFSQEIGQPRNPPKQTA